MRSFIQTRQPTERPQALQLMYNGTTYHFRLLHTALDQVREGRGRRGQEHIHAVYHIVLYSRGDSEFLLDGQATSISPGLLVLSSPGQSHDYGPSTGTACYSELSFSFLSDGAELDVDFRQLLQLFFGMELEVKAFPQQLQPAQALELDLLLSQHMDALEHNAASAVLVQRLVAILTHLAINCYQTPAISSEHQGLTSACHYLRQNYTERISIDDLARLAAMSRSHFLRSFKATHGTTPIALQQKLRMDAAKTLLRSTNLHCHEIGQRVGYEDVYHFSKSFKKVCGVSPTAFRTSL